MDAGFVDNRLFANVVSGGFGSRVTAETDPKLKERLGGLAYALTGVAHFTELSSNHGRFRAEGFAWEGDFVAFAIGNGRQAGGGVPLCPNALIDDGLLDLTIVPAMDAPAYLDTFAQLLRDGAAGIQASLVTTEALGSPMSWKAKSTSTSMANRSSLSVFRSKYASACFQCTSAKANCCPPTNAVRTLLSEATSLFKWPGRSDKRISVRRVRHPRPLYAAYTPTELASRRRWAAMAAA